MSDSKTASATKLEILGPRRPGYDDVLTPEALAFVADLVARFGGRVDELLRRREAVQARFDRGEKPDFLAETRAIREGDWKVAPLPKDLLDRRVEITGPVDRKMVINALNSGANVFMADFEDSNAPTWDNCVQGQINLRDALVAYVRHQREVITRRSQYRLDKAKRREHILEGRIKALDLTALEDDRSFFPKYNASLVVRQQTLEEHPEIEKLFAPVTEKLTNEVIASLNAKVDVDGRDASEVAWEWLSEEGLVR